MLNGEREEEFIVHGSSGLRVGGLGVTGLSGLTGKINAEKSLIAFAQRC